jgi:hypothetical protein
MRSRKLKARQYNGQEKKARQYNGQEKKAIHAAYMYWQNGDQLNYKTF